MNSTDVIDLLILPVNFLNAWDMSLACNPNPQPEALTPIPTLAPAAELTLIPSLEGAPATGGVASTSAPARSSSFPTSSPRSWVKRPRP